jgi:hypothetical protein
MNEREKSDRLVLPVKPSNNAAQAAAEVVEGRGLREGNATSKARRTQSWSERAKCARSRALYRREGQGCTVHRAAAPR